MRIWKFTAMALCVATLALSACGNSRSASGRPEAVGIVDGPREISAEAEAKSSIWDLFGGGSPEQTVQVNRYLWAASLDVLGFLPIQSADPFTGLIVTGYGKPPGGGKAYRATVHISDPALEARALNVSLQSQSGAVSPATSRAVEDAILSRARQMRINDDKL